MFSYRTVEEKALEWGVTPRHVQVLCREGKIEGAEKRAGAWFIPDVAPDPTKNKKADEKPYEFVGTKKKIFLSAIYLFTNKGYENVSMNDIAEAVNIRQSALYNHFASKQQILDTIYDYYSYNNLVNRPSLDELDTLLHTGSLLDIITKGFIYSFDEEALGPMSDITKIIVQRASTDPTATAIFRKMSLDEGIRFVEEGLDKAMAIGRLAPFDTHAIAVLINAVRVYMLINWIVCPQPEHHEKVEKDEQTVYKHIITLLTDLKPPASSQ